MAEADGGHIVSDSDYGEGAEPLTPTERGRLRPTVDAATLERWLIATRGLYRPMVIAHFAQEVTADDLRASYGEIPATAEEMAELERCLAEEPPPPGPIHHPGPDSPPGAVAFQPVPYTDYILQMTPPDDPPLRDLWDAIERG